MSDRLRCERDVLNLTGWPSRKYLDGRIKHDGFPRPNRKLYAIGDQWLESAVRLHLGLIHRPQPPLGLLLHP
jgi:hypothetical protein